MSDQPVKCVQPAGGLVQQAAPAAAAPESKQEVRMAPLARVGKEAPDFETNCYKGGKFGKVKLSDSRGHWTMVCFYPGDFTFV
jgi:hypothetical protein